MLVVELFHWTWKFCVWHGPKNRPLVFMTMPWKIMACYDWWGREIFYQVMRWMVIQISLSLTRFQFNPMSLFNTTPSSTPKTSWETCTTTSIFQYLICAFPTHLNPELAWHCSLCAKIFLYVVGKIFYKYLMRPIQLFFGQSALEDAKNRAL
jgi:hypothetical protein